MALSKAVIAIATKHAEQSVAIRTLLLRQAVISDEHQKQLISDLRKLSHTMPDGDEARKIRGLLYSVKNASPKTVTTTLYGHC